MNKMAHDLILGRIRRDWSCGSFMSPLTETSRRQMALDVSAQTDSKKLGQLVRDEIQRNFTTILKLDTAKRLPVVERKSFGTFMKKWVAFGTSHDGEFTGEDVVALNNFREANKRFTERLAIFDQMAKAPLKEPLRLAPLGLAPTTSTEMVQYHPPGWQGPTASRPWGWLISIGLGLAGLGFLVGKNR